jgi:hypothetical protein
MNRGLYQIIDWDGRYENYRSRPVKRCSFVSIPNDDDPASAAINRQFNGLAVMGVWHNLLKLCSRQPSPRQGYVTIDGTRSGWPLSAEELAHMWKQPAAMVRYALRVLTSPQVSLIRVAAGSVDIPDDTRDDTADDTADDTKIDTADDTTAADTADDTKIDTADDIKTDTADDTAGIASADAVCKYVSKYVPPMVPHGGTEIDNTSGDTRNDTSGDTRNDTSGDTRNDTGNDTARIVDMNLEKTKQWLNALFGRQVAWSYEEDELLSKQHPIAAKDRALLSWAYTAPVDADGWVAIEGQRLSKRKQSILTLLRELPAEIDKWKAMRAQLNEDDGSPEPSGNGWTAERIQARQERFPEANWPERFDEVPIDVQRVIDRRAEQLVEKNE